MTRSITIVNTSNWDGEDYLIGIPGHYDFRSGCGLERASRFTPAQVDHGRC